MENLFLASIVSSKLINIDYVAIFFCECPFLGLLFKISAIETISEVFFITSDSNVWMFNDDIAAMIY